MGISSKDANAGRASLAPLRCYCHARSEISPCCCSTLNRPTPRHFRRTDDDPPSPHPRPRPRRRRLRPGDDGHARAGQSISASAASAPTSPLGPSPGLLAGAALLLLATSAALSPAGLTTVSPPAPTSSPRAGLASRAPCGPPARSSRCIAAAPTHRRRLRDRLPGQRQWRYRHHLRGCCNTGRIRTGDATAQGSAVHCWSITDRIIGAGRCTQLTVHLAHRQW